MEIWTPRDNPFQGPYQSQDPAELGQAAMYRLMTGAIQPRPIALITTLGPQGPNLAPFSFFTGVASHPPTLAFSIAWKKPLSQESSLPGEGEPKDTLRNLDYCDEFVVHFSSEWLLSAIQKCSIEFPWGSMRSRRQGSSQCHPQSCVHPGLKKVRFTLNVESQTKYLSVRRPSGARCLYSERSLRFTSARSFGRIGETKKVSQTLWLHCPDWAATSMHRSVKPGKFRENPKTRVLPKFCQKANWPPLQSTQTSS